MVLLVAAIFHSNKQSTVYKVIRFARNKIQIPNKPRNGYQQHQNIHSAYSYIVHTSEYQRNGRQQFDKTKHAQHSRSRNLKCGVRRPHPRKDRQTDKNKHYYRVGKHSQPKLFSRGTSAEIERACKKQLESFASSHIQSIPVCDAKYTKNAFQPTFLCTKA